MKIKKRRAVFEIENKMHYRKYNRYSAGSHVYEGFVPIGDNGRVGTRMHAIARWYCPRDREGVRGLYDAWDSMNQEKQAMDCEMRY